MGEEGRPAEERPMNLERMAAKTYRRGPCAPPSQRGFGKVAFGQKSRPVSEAALVAGITAQRCVVGHPDTLSVQILGAQRGKRSLGAPKPLRATQEARRTTDSQSSLCRCFLLREGGPSLGGLEPPTFRLTAERAGPLRHRDEAGQACAPLVSFSVCRAPHQAVQRSVCPGAPPGLCPARKRLLGSPWQRQFLSRQPQLLAGLLASSRDLMAAGALSARARGCKEPSAWARKEGAGLKGAARACSPVSGWPSGRRRCVQVAVSPGGVGSSPTPDNSPCFSLQGLPP